MRLIYIDERGQPRGVDVPSVAQGKNVRVPIPSGGVSAVIGFDAGKVAEISKRMRAEAELTWMEGSKVHVTDPRDVLALCDALDLARGDVDDAIMRDKLTVDDVKHFKEMVEVASENGFQAPITGDDLRRLCQMIEVLAARSK